MKANSEVKIKRQTLAKCRNFDSLIFFICLKVNVYARVHMTSYTSAKLWLLSFQVESIAVFYQRQQLNKKHIYSRNSIQQDTQYEAHIFVEAQELECKELYCLIDDGNMLRGSRGLMVRESDL